MKQKVQPKSVIRVNCPKCGELMVKLFPYSTISISPGQKIPDCIKCFNKVNTSVRGG